MITLLPKDGKDTKDIKNWRPITLSNCDSKIITKGIYRKTYKVLESIIDPSKTAYVPGRLVAEEKTLMQCLSLTHVRIKKYKMTVTDKCPRCSMTETLRHLLYDSVHVKNICSIFNSMLNRIGNGQECVNCEFVKIKVIQALIQIERPLNWNREKFLDTIKNLINIVRYNDIVLRTVNKLKIKWEAFENIIFDQ